MAATLSPRQVRWPSTRSWARTIAHAVLADSVGVDFIGIGEHHGNDYSISAPDIVLAAVAGQTERIRLGTAVTVLSSFTEKLDLFVHARRRSRSRRSARSRIPTMLAIIGGDPARFLPYVDLYKRAAEQLSVPAMPLGAHSPGHIAATDAQAREQLWPHFKTNRDRIGAERG